MSASGSGPGEPDNALGIEVLREMALDLRWTWSHAGDDLWRMVDPDAWRATENPWLILQGLTSTRLQELARDATFQAALQRLREERRLQSGDAEPGVAPPATARATIAYFSMEFGFGSALPLYAGGLGILAADHLKASSDVGLPVTAVGLLYQEGYFRQQIHADGRQEELYPYNDPTALPIQPQLAPGGGWLWVPLELPGRTLRLRVWRATVGRCALLLLDSNDPWNAPADRGITGKLYDAGNERRLQQEIVLGIGGYRALEAAGLAIGVCHLNEGHAAFAALERARGYKRHRGCSFQTALWATRAGNIFTTHTPVAAGFDEIEPALLERYFPDGRGYLAELGLSFDGLLALGRPPAAKASAPFRPAFLALRAAGQVNGVSALHAEVSRRLFQPLFPRCPAHEVPIGYVTNGVHTPSWDSRWADALWTRTCGKDRWRGKTDRLEPMIRAISDEEILAARGQARGDLIQYARARVRRQLAQRGAPPETVACAERLLDPDVLTLGFARRFAAYKRPNLLLRQPERLRRLLLDPARPVQLIIAGKAHPHDQEGRSLIAEWVRFIGDIADSPRLVFLEDYDITMAQELVRGADLWINTPRRPFEACGTSGMKVLVNGGLNLSVRDGWWAEAYSPEVGWAIGDGRDDSAPDADDRDTEDLYRVLETEVVPMFYDRDAQGIPRRWLERVRASLSRLAPRFSAGRMVREYDQRWYRPAEGMLARRTEQEAAFLARWEDRLREHLPQVRWGRLEIRADGADWDIEVELYLDDLDPSDVIVEIYADPSADHASIRAPMSERRPLPGTMHGHVFGTRVLADRPPEAFTPRLVPNRAERAFAGEAPLLLWHH